MTYLGSKAGGFMLPVPPPVIFGHHDHDSDDFGAGGFGKLFDGFSDCFRFRGDHDHDDRQLVPTQLNGSLDLSATDGHGHADWGSGNPAVGGWDVQHNTAAGIEGAFEIVHRQGDAYPVYSVDSHGVLQYYVTTGPQIADPAHHVPGANPNRAEWSFNWSLDALGTNRLGDYNIHMSINTGTSHLNLHLEQAPAGNPTHSQSGFVWALDGTHTPVFGDSGGVLNHVDANSENVAFLTSVLNVAPGFGPQTFDIEITATHGEDHISMPLWGGKGSPHITHEDVTVLDLHAQVHVVAPTDFHLV